MVTIANINLPGKTEREFMGYNSMPSAVPAQGVVVLPWILDSLLPELIDENL